MSSNSLIPEEVFSHYQNFALKAFSYLNGRVNDTIKNCMLYIDFFDPICNTYSNYLSPYGIYLHLGEILVDSISKFDKYLQDPICTSIMVCLTHELIHANQNINFESYRNNKIYHKDIEMITVQYSYVFLFEHSKEIYDCLGVDLNFSLESIPGVLVNYIMEGNQLERFPAEYKFYNKVTPQEYYINTVTNIVGNVSNNFLSDVNIKNLCLIFICGVDQKSIIIKSNGLWLYENLECFAYNIWYFFRRFNIFNCDINSRVSNNTGYMQFNICADSREITPIFIENI